MNEWTDGRELRLTAVLSSLSRWVVGFGSLWESSSFIRPRRLFSSSSFTIAWSISSSLVFSRVLRRFSGLLETFHFFFSWVFPGPQAHRSSSFAFVLTSFSPDDDDRFFSLEELSLAETGVDRWSFSLFHVKKTKNKLHSSFLSRSVLLSFPSHLSCFWTASTGISWLLFSFPWLGDERKKNKNEATERTKIFLSSFLASRSSRKHHPVSPYAFLARSINVFLPFSLFLTSLSRWPFLSPFPSQNTRFFLSLGFLPSAPLSSCCFLSQDTRARSQPVFFSRKKDVFFSLLLSLRNRSVEKTNHTKARIFL